MRLLPRDSDLAWTPYAWLIYIVPFAATPLYSARHADAAGWALHVAATLVFLVLYFRSYWVRGRELALITTATVLLGVALWPFSYGAGAFFIYGAAMAGQLDPSRWAIRSVAFIALVTVVEGIFLRREWFAAAWPPVFVLIIGGINIHFCQVARANAKLRLARDEIEHLAKVAERERIARDLHDLLGHTLSLVVLKSELASKLSERDPERARDEIRDVERIAREALAEVRAAVRGYRAGGLAAEVQHAHSTLSTAGVVLESEISKSPIPPAQEAVLCLALREAVTNIVRHAGARQCRIRLRVIDDAAIMTIADDGRGGNEPFGSGLLGMRERVELIGGTLQRDGRQGTTLTVRVPLHAAATPIAREQSA
ncbi:MAG TPA: sensor histidine kinase [Thermoanaerobaculia bacterium]|nr:sensor histidine kinase [Thermoanaerobaculia bacterium]